MAMRARRGFSELPAQPETQVMEVGDLKAPTGISTIETPSRSCRSRILHASYAIDMLESLDSESVTPLLLSRLTDVRRRRWPRRRRWTLRSAGFRRSAAC